jgi:hypothetical protein
LIAMPVASTFADLFTDRLVAFVRGIGIDVRAATLPKRTNLPGPHVLCWLR